MSIGRLAWRTPTGAMLWEIWGRQRFLIILQGVALLGNAIAAQFAGGFSKDASELFTLLSYQAGGLAILLALTCFCHMEIDARRLQGGFPGYLLIKPVATIRLVSLPMFCGGIAVVAVFLAWVTLVWRHVGFPMPLLPWFCAVLFSTTWSVQAIAWSTANLPWGCPAALMLGAVGVNALAGLVPGSWEMAYRWRLGILGTMLAGSFLLAVVGVQRVRRGAWEGGGISLVRGQTARRQKSKPFPSAFRAQFWLEWRRQGWTLPIFTALGLIAIIGLVEIGVRFISHKWGDPSAPDDPSVRLLIVNYAILTPIFCSGMLSAMLPGFDLAPATGGLPVYVATRPMTNGTFVAAKLAMAAVSSAVTWFVVLGLLLVWAALGAPAEVAGTVWRILVSKPREIVVFAFSLALLILLTWRNLVAGIWVGMAGRPGLTGGVMTVRLGVYFILGGVVAEAVDNLGFRAGLFDWLPWILSVGLCLKLSVSSAAFNWGFRRNAITRGAICWMTGSWIGGGILVAAMVNKVSAALPLPIAWPWIALAACLSLPLADLALAPLALRWNRHR